MGSELPVSLPSGHTAAAHHSRFVQRIRRRYAAELPLLRAGLPDAAAMQAVVQALLSGEN